MGNRVEEYFRREGLPYRVEVLEQSTATVPLAAQALGVPAGQIAKSLAVWVGEQVIVLVLCGTARLDNRRFKAAFGVKPRMLTPEEALERTGYPVGGVCPFALPEDVRVYLDESLRAFETVCPAAGAPNACTRIAPEALAELTCACWTDVARNPEAEEDGI